MSRCSRRSTPTAGRSRRGRSELQEGRHADHAGERREIGALEAAAVRAAQTGREQEAVTPLDPDPRHRPAPRADADGARPARVSPGRHGVRARNVPADRRRRRQRIAQQWIHLARRLPQPEGRSGRGECDSPGAGASTRIELVALILRANLLERQGKTARGRGRAYRAVGDRRPADRAPASGAAPRRRPGARAVGPVQPGTAAPSSTGISSRISRRSPARTSSGFAIPSTSWSAARSVTTRSRSLYHYPGLPAIEFFDRAGFSVARPDRGRNRRDPRRIPRGPRRPRRDSPPTSPTRTTCRTTSSRSSTTRRAGARSTSTRWAKLRRGERRALPDRRWGARGALPSPTSRDARPRRCSRC